MKNEDKNIALSPKQFRKIGSDQFIDISTLDETDEDILKYVIGDKTETGKLKLNPQKVIIFYYEK